MSDPVNHPDHYGGKDNPYEAIKVIEAWGLGFHLGNAVKYIARAGKKGDTLQDLRKAIWYIQRYIEVEIVQKELMSHAKDSSRKDGDENRKGSLCEVSGSE
jgi:hypothetical protein